MPLLQCLVKPPVKESTRPIDLKLHSDVRAIDRAEFDHQVPFHLFLPYVIIIIMVSLHIEILLVLMILTAELNCVIAAIFHSKKNAKCRTLKQSMTECSIM